MGGLVIGKEERRGAGRVCARGGCVVRGGVVWVWGRF